MCGIAGMVDWRAATSADALRSIGEAMIETLRHRGPDGGGGLGRGRRRRGARPAPARHHRSQPRRRAADALGRPALRHHLQRRDLQLPRHPPRARSRRPRAAQRFRYRGAARSLRACGAWKRRSSAPSACSPSRCGTARPGPCCWRATASASSRSTTRRRRSACCSLRSSRRFVPFPDWKPTIDDDAVAGYLRHAYIAQPRTIYREARKLPPGHILTLREGRAPAPKCFWDLRGIAVAGQRRNDPAPDENEAVERLDALLRDSVKLRMIADVPLGAFLSGGIDSSTVVALMQAQSTRPVKTFSIGFHESGYDEAQSAKRRRRPSRHRPHRILRRAAPRARRHSAAAGLVRRAVRRSVADSDLSGLRADPQARHRGAVGRRRRRAVRRLQPLFLGASGWRARRSCVPRPLRGAIGRGRCARCRRRPGTGCSPSCRPRWRPALPGDKLHKIATLLDNPAPDAIYRRLVSQWERPDEIAAARQRAARAAVGRDHRARFPRLRPAHAVPRHGDLSARRHPDQGRPRHHGGRARGQGAAARPSRGGLFLEPAARLQGARRAGQMAAAPRARPLRAAGR